MNEQVYTPKQLSQKLGVACETLRAWANKGVIKCTTTTGGHRRYLYADPEEESGPQEISQSSEHDGKKRYIYARVSAPKQRLDLERQINVLKEAFPEYEVVKDIASGINFKRPGLLKILEAVFRGEVSTVVVAHRDRLCRFGYDLLAYIFQYFNVQLRLLEDPEFKEPSRELADDLMAVVTVFAARYHGSRKYKVLQEDKVLSKQRTGVPVQPLHRRLKVFLQQGRKASKRSRKG